MKSNCISLLAGVVACACVQSVSAGGIAKSKVNVFYSFCSQQGCADGSIPKANLINVNGMFYGTAYGGGNVGWGTLFTLDPNTRALTVLHSFGGGTDGADPASAVLYVKGKLYGTTFFGGANDNSDAGTAFVFDLSTKTETVLHAFGSGQDGINPKAGLIEVNGTLYGTTEEGGAHSYGTLYSLNPYTGAETVVYSFGSGADGSVPDSGLIDVNGMLYGTTLLGGAAGFGTVFAFDPTTDVEAVLHSFTGNPDGIYPSATLINEKGMLYGTTSGGGTTNAGTVFAFDPNSGKETVLHSFRGKEGGSPVARLIDANGTLYGTASEGGKVGSGTVFGLNLSTGAMKVFHSFCSQQNCTDGDTPDAGLIDVSGALYGTTFGGGVHNEGTVFVLKP